MVFVVTYKKFVDKGKRVGASEKRFEGTRQFKKRKTASELVRKIRNRQRNFDHVQNQNKKLGKNKDPAIIGFSTNFIIDKRKKRVTLK